jgi:hypothetical protein
MPSGPAGNPFASPGRSCRPDLMASTYAELGRRSLVPSLWLYAVNDRYWGEQAPKDWHAAYGKGELVVTQAVGDDGHQLLTDGQALWQAPLEAFTHKVGFHPGRRGQP